MLKSKEITVAVFDVCTRMEYKQSHCNKVTSKIGYLLWKESDESRIDLFPLSEYFISVFVYIQCANRNLNRMKMNTCPEMYIFSKEILR